MSIIVFDSKEEIFEKQSRRGVIGEMEQYIRGVAFMAVPALIFCGILANSMRKDRSRYRNTFFVMFAGISVVGFLCALAGPYSGLVFLACFILILLSILIAPVSLIINGIIMIRKEGKRLPNGKVSDGMRDSGRKDHKRRFLFAAGWLLFISPVLIDILC
ncbi:MAG: hypothetical protein SO401_03415 [Blautia sp.]|nr:hypothetical protein [Blautia sp.]